MTTLRWCPHTPTPKQSEFLALTDLEALYGGAAGGGKSDALLMGALQHVNVPGYSAILFRRTFMDLALPDSIMDRAHKWLGGTDAQWDGTRKRYTFPSGATLQFGYLDASKDRFRYKSAAFQYAGFDELTTIEEQSYLYILSRLRRLTKSNVPIRARSASNPGDIGHEWVKARFVDGDRAFVPATMNDNPHLDTKSYREALSQLDHVTRQQLEDGVWEQDPSTLLYEKPSAIVTTLPKGIWTYVRAITFGIKDAHAIVVLGWCKHDPSMYVLSATYFRGGPVSLEVELAKDVRVFSRNVGDIGDLGETFQSDLAIRRGIIIEPANATAKGGALRLINDDLRIGTLKIYAPGCKDLLKEMGALLRREDGTEHPEQDNRCCNAMVHGWRVAPSYLERSRIEVPAFGSEAWEAKEIEKLEQDEATEERRYNRRRRHGWIS